MTYDTRRKGTSNLGVIFCVLAIAFFSIAMIRDNPIKIEAVEAVATSYRESGTAAHRDAGSSSGLTAVFGYREAIEALEISSDAVKQAKKMKDEGAVLCGLALCCEIAGIVCFAKKGREQ